jgi:2-phospho-L-lactate guanylyltransferase
MTQPGSWCLVVPVKRLALAKSRLASVAGAHRSDLALAFALDTVAAALACAPVRLVVAVTDEPVAATALADLGATVVSDRPDAGLNPALAHGAEFARARHRDCGVGALSADLPALRPGELTIALGQAAGHDVCFVRDAGGDGTTLLLARQGARLEPQFGASSARLHAHAGAVELTGELASLRRDVDTEDDLAAASLLGLGPRSAAVAGRLAALRSG